jgi:tetratricopeptide (TPR) repeat protein
VPHSTSTNPPSALLSIVDEGKLAGVVTASDPLSPSLELDFQAAERQLQQDRRNTTILQRMIDIAQKLGDPVRLSRCYATMSQLLSDPKQRADYLIKAAVVTRDGRGEPLKAAAGFMLAIELDPDRLDAFQMVTEIYAQMQDWEMLEQTYRRMIGWHAGRERPNTLVISKLWRKLGTLLSDPIGRHEDATVAVRSAIRFAPHELKNHATLLEIYQRWPGHAVESADALSEMIRLENDRTELLRNLRLLADAYVQAGDHDGVYCVCRVLECLGRAMPQERDFIARFRRPSPKPIEQQLTPAQWQNVFYPPNYSQELAQIMATLVELVHDIIARELPDYGLSLRDRIDAATPLLFNKTIQQVSTLFGLEQLPDVFLAEQLDVDIKNGMLEPSALIVSRTLLSGKSPTELAFVVAKQVALLRRDFYLAGVSPVQDIELFLVAASKALLPDVDVPASKDIDTVARLTKTKLDEERRADFTEKLRLFWQHGAVPNRELGETGQAPNRQELFVQQVDAIANRLAFLVCDDLSVACACIQAESKPIGGLTPEQRIDALRRFAASSPYVKLRKELGLSIAQR